MQRPADQCHHFRAVDMLTEGQAIQAKFASICVVCETVVAGPYVGNIPPCAAHWHKPKEL